MQRAQLLHGALTDDDGRPLRMASLETFRINGIVNLRGPSVIGRDDKGRVEIVSNFDAEFLAIED